MASQSLAEARETALGPPIWALDTATIVSAPDHLACAAADALGWDGVVLPPTVLLGRRVVAVATLLDEVHERRVSAGWGPVTDRVAVSTWDWPEVRHRVPSPAVHLTGIIAPARHWRTGLTVAAPFARLCPTALLLPAHIARNVECLRHAECYGPTVLAAAGTGDVDPEAVDVVHVGRCRPLAATPLSTTSRRVYEMIYELMLARH